MFSTLPQTNFNFSVAFILSSASAFNVDQSISLSFGKELNLYHTTQSLDDLELGPIAQSGFYFHEIVPGHANSEPQPNTDEIKEIHMCIVTMT